MIRLGVFMLIAVGVAKAATIAETVCLSDADCLATQCCYKKHADLVVSKRGNTFEGYPVHNQDLTNVHGVCMGYHNEGDACSPFDKMNGYCSCNEKAGQTCTFAHTDDLVVSRRRKISAGYTCTSIVV